MKSYASMVLGGETRNVEQLGAYIAWLISNHLLADHVERSASRSATRVRMQDLNGGDFLATELHGELMPEHLNETGRAFTEAYLLSGQYDADYQQVTFEGENEWLRYEELAPLISKAFQVHRAPKKVGFANTVAKILPFPSRKK